MSMSAQKNSMTRIVMRVSTLLRATHATAQKVLSWTPVEIILASVREVKPVSYWFMLRNCISEKTGNGQGHQSPVVPNNTVIGVVVGVLIAVILLLVAGVLIMRYVRKRF